MRTAFYSRFIIVVLALGPASGCSVSDRLLSTAEKIYRAFPPPAELRVAIEDARELFKNDSEGRKTLEDRIDSQIELRSLICTREFSIGRFDSVKTIKTLPVRKECLAEQDESLAATVGTFVLGYLLAQPPLRPLAALDDAPAIPKIGGFDTAFSFSAASQANVLLVRGTRVGDFASVEIPSGKTLATMPHIPGASHRMYVSPNGRLVALNINRSSVIFLDMERGSKLWDLRRIKEFYAWLPDVHAALVRGETGHTMLLDFQTGRLEAYPAGSKNLSWVTPANRKGAVWLGSDREVFGVEHVRVENRVQTTVTKIFRLSRTRISSRPPTLMRQGKMLFFISGLDFSSLDLETGEETAWNVARFLANRYAKLSEDTLLVDSYDVTGSGGFNAWVMNVTERTLAPVDESTTASRYDLLKGLMGRTGWIRRGHGTTYMGGTVDAGTPEPLDQLASAFNMERQIAKLKLMERRREMRESGKSNPWPRMPASQALGPARSVSESPAPRRVGLPPNVPLALHVVGVYEGTIPAGADKRPWWAKCNDERKNNQFSADHSPPSSECHQKYAARNTETEVVVKVSDDSKPIVLGLTGYNKIHWKVSLGSGVKLAKVILAGYHAQRVSGIPTETPVDTYTRDPSPCERCWQGATYFYSYKSPPQQLTDITGLDVTSFQGRYQGSIFSIFRGIASEK